MKTRRKNSALWQKRGQHYAIVISTPLGKLGIACQNNQLSSIALLEDTTLLQKPQDALGKKIIAELEAYFKNPQHSFKLDYEPQGTPFQQQVWRAVKAIPCGQTLTYGALAKQLKTGPRAIGQACRTNPLPIIIPCHRIVASNHLGGYAGATNGALMRIKTWLLTHEQQRTNHY